LLLLLGVSQAYAANQIPVANAGIDQSIGTGLTVQLDGLKSFDNDGAIKTYRWTQLKGQKVKLSNAKLAAPSFTTPATLPAKDSARTLIFKLTVSDTKNKKASDTVTVNLVACNAPKILVNNVCQLPPPVCYLPNKWQDGECLPPAPLTCKAPLVPIDGACRFPPVVCNWPEVEQNGVCAVPVASTLINDTGIVWCYDLDNKKAGCPVSTYPGQDAEFGRDELLNDDSDGRAGFSFSKLDTNGELLPAAASEWSCVKDNVTGLIWENKTDDGGLRDKDNVYSYYGADFDPNSEFQTATDATGYVNTINSLHLCGASDWRLPTLDELQGIVDFSVIYPGPTIDSGFFSATANKEYWASTLYPADIVQGWVVYFTDGRIFRDQRNLRYSVRLVRDSRLNAGQSGGQQ